MEHNSTNAMLGEFLRARRERLTLEEVGLPSYGRRRTPGLRREEVAQLAHIGTSWYASLEQGRDINPSEDVLNSLAKALRLTDEECRHLHKLARPYAERKEDRRELSIGLEKLIGALEMNPSLIMGGNWDLIVWNPAAELVFRLPSFSDETLTLQRPNWLRRFLLDPVLQANNADWEEKARVMIARFRADYAHSPHDAKCKDLIDELMERSPLFRESWPRHDVQAVDDCHKLWNDPRIGQMEFEHIVLQAPTHPELKILVYLASPDTIERLKGILGSDS